MKYNKTIRAKIIELYKDEKYTIDDICKICDISRTTFHNWINKYPAFKNDIETAKNIFKNDIKKNVLNSIKIISKIHVLKETVTVKNKKGQVIETTEKLKEYPPNNQILKQFLIDIYPELFTEKKEEEEKTSKLEVLIVKNENENTQRN